MKVRTDATGTRIIIPDSKITRALDALVSLARNRVVEGCWVTGGVSEYVVLSAGVVSMNNKQFKVAEATYPAGSYTMHGFSTLYIPSSAISALPTVQVMASTAANYFAPGTPNIGKDVVLLAHMKRSAAGAPNASTIDNNVRPRLFDGGPQAWDKHTW